MTKMGSFTRLMKSEIRPCAVSSRPARMLLFARNFFKHPKMLGSPIPSPKVLIEEVLGRVVWPEARLVVEYGPGVGDFTGEILRRMRPEARLVVIETNDEFVECLRESLPDPRLHVAHGSAAEVGSLLARLGCGRADCIISGIPFSTMPGSAREEILSATCSVLQPRGNFLVYQYSRRVFPSLKRVFREVHRDFRLLGFLPIWLFHCAP
jgi:phospholipid N-methyltransferase